MSQSISLFSGYNQKENRTTNYCLLVLKLLYEENPKFLSEVISTIVDETVGNYVGVSFLQQQGKKTSVPDGLIRQMPFTIYIEAKNYDWFYDEQLEQHLRNLNDEVKGAKVLLALSNFESSDLSRFDPLQQHIEAMYRDEIFFNTVSFDEFLQAVRSPQIPKNLADIIEDFAAYLDGQGLLSSWQNTLDVVNCARIPDDILVHHVYMCPATSGHYSHKRCRYFGMYRSKAVEQVALIKGLVELESTTKGIVKWKNVDAPDADLVAEARASHQAGRPGYFPIRVFVLDNLYPTTFIKSTSGGMQGSKQYFDVSRLNVTTADELSQKLNGKSWKDLNA